MHSTSSVLIRELTERLTARGLSVGAIEREVSATVPRWSDPDARWPLSSFAALTRLAIAELGDPALGLHVAETMPPERQHVASRIARASGTFREAAAAWARYASLVSTADRFRQEDRGGRSRLCYLPLADAPPLPFLHEHYLVLARRMLDGALGARAENASFDIALRAPAHAPEYRRVLGPHVTFDAECTAIEIDVEAADAPLPHADPYLDALLRDTAERWLGGIEPAEGSSSVASRVLATLGDTEELDGSALRGRVALALAMSEKALQRRLCQEGVTFRDLVDRHRRERALAWVREGQATVDVAWRLGFSEVAAFTRAFRRWSGTTVARYRRAHRAAP